MTVQLREDERGEVPDVFLVRARLAKAAAREPAADGEKQRDELAGEHRRRGDHQADDGARVRAGDEAREKRTLEREIGRVVIEQQT